MQLVVCCQQSAGCVLTVRMHADRGCVVAISWEPPGCLRDCMCPGSAMQEQPSLPGRGRVFTAASRSCPVCFCNVVFLHCQACQQLWPLLLQEGASVL